MRLSLHTSAFEAWSDTCLTRRDTIWTISIDKRTQARCRACSIAMFLVLDAQPDLCVIAREIHGLAYMKCSVAQTALT